MNPAASHRTESAAAAATTAQIKDFLELYGSTFASLAAGTRSDVETLLQFYEAPFRYVGDHFHWVLKESGDILGPDGIGGEVARLRHTGYQGSTLDRCEVEVLNQRAAWVRASWRREGQQGTSASFTVAYFVALTEAGWRITTAANAPG